MVGLVVATHGRLGEELLVTAAAVCGPLEQAVAVSLASSQPVDEARARLAAAIHSVDAGDGVLVLTDLFGGTPANLALTFLDEHIEVLTGVNLPMLLKLSTLRATGTALEPAAETLAGYGQKNINLASRLLRSKASGQPDAK